MQSETRSTAVCALLYLHHQDSDCKGFIQAANPLQYPADWRALGKCQCGVDHSNGRGSWVEGIALFAIPQVDLTGVGIVLAGLQGLISPS